MNSEPLKLPLKVSLLLSSLLLSVIIEAGEDGCELRKVAAEDRGNSRCFNEPECEEVCRTVESQVCTIIHREQCSPVTKQHCTNSSSPVCTTVYQEVCEGPTEPACSTGMSCPPPAGMF